MAVPEGWREARFGEALREVDERRADGDAAVLSVTKSRGPMLASERFGKTMHGRNLEVYRLARRGTIVADPMLLWDGTIGLQDVVDVGAVSPDYRVYDVASGVDTKFMSYVVRDPWTQRYYAGGARGTNVRRNRIAREDFLRIPLRLPPLPEQRKIAAILSSVDETIEKTEAVIEQLQVVKKAMMEELLTRGMPGRHTRFKQTEIGEVPEGWDVRRLDEVAEGPTNGKSPPAKLNPPGVPTFSIAAIRNGRVNVRENLKYADVTPDEVKNFVVRKGDVMIVRGNGNQALVGKCGVVDDAPDGCIYPDILMRVRPLDPIRTQFLVEVWNSDIVHEQVLDRAKTTNGTYKINGADVRSIRLPVPPLEEQDTIGSALASLDQAARSHDEALQALRNLKVTVASVLLSGDLRVTPDEAPP